MPGATSAQRDSARQTQYLSIANLTIADKRENDVVTDINFDVEPGKFVGIVGETGSGKSIVLKAMLALLPEGLMVAQGTLSVNRDELLLGGKAHRKLLGHTLGFVPQDPLSSLNPVRTIYAQAKELVKKERKKRHEQIVAAMTKAGLDNPDSVIYKYPHELSGGLRQRVLIGLALIQHPKYIFCDEGTTALDVIVQRSVMQTLRYAVDNLGVGLVFVSHDIALIGSFSDHIVVMYGGRAVEAGAAREVLLRPNHPYTEALINAEPKMEVGRVPNPIPGNVPPPGHRPRGCVYAPRCSYKQAKCASLNPPMTRSGNRDYACWFPIGA